MFYSKMARPDPNTRHVFWLPISANKTEFLAAVLCHISSNQLTMIVDQRLEAGTVIAVRFSPDENDNSWAPWAHVVYSFKQDSGHWLTGCRFMPGHSPLNAIVSPLGILSSVGTRGFL